METLFKIKIAIAEDHVLFREGLTARLSREKNVEIAGQFGNGKDLLAFLEHNHADVILMDIKMPEMDGIQATRKIVEKYSNIKVVALTSFDNDYSLKDMLHAGARGYLIKNADYQEIISVIFDVYEGGTSYCKFIAEKIRSLIVQERYHPDRYLKDLLPMELQIIKYICLGLNAKETADKIGMSVRTVEGFKSKILVKLDVKNTNAVVMYAIRNKLVDKEDVGRL